MAKRRPTARKPQLVNGAPPGIPVDPSSDPSAQPESPSSQPHVSEPSSSVKSGEQSASQSQSEKRPARAADGRRKNLADPANGNYDRKPDKAELSQRIRKIADMIVRRARKGEIKRYCNDTWGVTATTAERYIARAKKQLLARTGRAAEQHRAEAFHFYENIMRKPGSGMKAIRLKMEAQEAIRTLLGLDAPTKIANTTPDGTISTDVLRAAFERMTDDQLLALSQIRQQIEASTKTIDVGGK